MPAIAITGNIGSGKSLFIDLLTKSLGAIPFSADAENRRLLDEDPEVRKLIMEGLGRDCYLPDGHADRARIFELISGKPSLRSILEEILHPRLEALWKPQANRYRGRNDIFFLAEIPLLYEKSLEVFFDKILVVGCSESVRRERLVTGRSLSKGTVAGWTKLQQPQQGKIEQADYLVWNDGSTNALQLQLHLLASRLLTS